jgi:hypothetical protein
MLKTAGKAPAFDLLDQDGNKARTYVMAARI